MKIEAYLEVGSRPVRASENVILEFTETGKSCKRKARVKVDCSVERRKPDLSVMYCCQRFVPSSTQMQLVCDMRISFPFTFRLATLLLVCTTCSRQPDLATARV